MADKKRAAGTERRGRKDPKATKRQDRGPAWIRDSGRERAFVELRRVFLERLDLLVAADDRTTRELHAGELRREFGIVFDAAWDELWTPREDLAKERDRLLAWWAVAYRLARECWKPGMSQRELANEVLARWPADGPTPPEDTQLRARLRRIRHPESGHPLPYLGQ